jgi:hypothetical protein
MVVAIALGVLVAPQSAVDVPNRVEFVVGIVILGSRGAALIATGN